MGASAAQSALTLQKAEVRQKTWLTALCFGAADAVAVGLAAAISLAAFQLLHLPPSSLIKELLPAVATLFVFAAFGSYSVVGLNPALEFQRVILGSATGYALGLEAVLVRQAAPPMTFDRYLSACVATILLVFTCRSICRALCCNLAWWGTPAVLFGSGPDAHAVFRAIQRHRTSLKIVAAFDESPIDWPELDRQHVHVSTPGSAAHFAAQCGVSYAIIAMPGFTGAEIGQVIKKHASGFKHVLVLPGLTGISSVWVEPRAVAGMLGLHVTQTLLHRRPQFVKRAFDLLLAPAAALFLLPVFAVICLAVWASSRGPIFYGHVRIGRGSSSFKAWKFRTMHPDADQILSACLERDPDLRAQWQRDHKLKNDPRVTFVGRILRKTSLDELPQLWNVLAGEMSFVGPRPIVSAEAARYGDSFETYASVRPGITGLWQVSGRNNTTYEERVQFDEYYVRNWSVWLDLYIVSRTFKTVLLREGAY